MKIMISEQQLKYIFNEALSLDKAKEYSSMSRRPQAQDNVNLLFDSIKKNFPESTTNRSGDRLYLPFKENTDVSNKFVNRETYDLIAGVIKSYGYTIKDYTLGIATEAKYNRDVKIGKILTSIYEKKDDPNIKDFVKTILNKFNNDPSRKNVKNSEDMIVFSKHPYDIAGMSTDRGWTSCMNVNGGVHCDYVNKDIEEGTVIAYLTKKSDVNINNPICRVLIRPLWSKNEKDVYYVTSKNVYGTCSYSFQNEVEKIIKASKITKNMNQPFHNSGGLYIDALDVNEIKYVYNQKELEEMDRYDRVEVAYQQDITHHNERNEKNIFRLGSSENTTTIINATTGDFLLEKNRWFDEIEDFHFNDDINSYFAEVMLNGKSSFLLLRSVKSDYFNWNTSCKLFDTWFDGIYGTGFICGYLGVVINKKSTFIDVNGNLIGDGKKYWDHIYGFDEEVCLSKVNMNDYGHSFINTDGEYITDKWFKTTSYGWDYDDKTESYYNVVITNDGIKRKLYQNGKFSSE